MRLVSNQAVRLTPAAVARTVRKAKLPSYFLYVQPARR
jgi:hypothetical protein